MSIRPGKVRVARLTDLAALGELSRLCQSEGVEARSLGLPVSGPPIGVFSLFRLPLGAFRPNDLLYVYEEDGRLAGLLRVERDSHRDEWTIVELDAIGAIEAGDIRFRLVQRLLREGAKRGAVRFHVACSDEGATWRRSCRQGSPDTVRSGSCSAAGHRAAGRMDRGGGRWLRHPPRRTARCGRAGTALRFVDAQPVQRLEAYRLADWERQGGQWRIPRSSLAPILRFADVDAYVQECRAAAGTALGSRLSPGRRGQGGPAALPQDHRPARRRHRPDRAVRPRRRSPGALGAGHRHDRGVMAAVRTYESPIDRRLEEAGFGTVATVTLLMKETLVSVAEPALVPAVR